jgi:hypothetical protein
MTASTELAFIAMSKATSSEKPLLYRHVQFGITYDEGNVVDSFECTRVSTWFGYSPET